MLVIQVGVEKIEAIKNNSGIVNTEQMDGICENKNNIDIDNTKEIEELI